MIARVSLLAVAACLLAACGRDGPTAPSALTTAASTPAAPGGDAEGVALWVDPADATRGVVLAAAEEQGLLAYGLDGTARAGASVGRAKDADVIEATFGDASRTVVAVADAKADAVALFDLDPATLALAARGTVALPAGRVADRVCFYRSPVSGELHLFAVDEAGVLEQFLIHPVAQGYAARAVRTLHMGGEAGGCAADHAARVVYAVEAGVGVWRFTPEPEAEFTRALVAQIAPWGGLTAPTDVAVWRDGAQGALAVADEGDAAGLHFFALGAAPTALGRVTVAGEGAPVAPESLALAGARLALQDPAAATYRLGSLDAARAALGLSRWPAAPVEAPRDAARVMASVETAPMPDGGDAADDPAIWVDHADPTRSLVIGTNKRAGLHLYDLAGRELQALPDGRMNNVDLRDGFPLAGGRVAIVAATERSTPRLALYALDPRTRRLRDVAAGRLDTGFDEPYGLCLYHDRAADAFYVIVNDDRGRVRQWRLAARADGRVGIELAREFALGSQTEGCVADDELGNLFVGEEDVGLWRYAAQPAGGDARALVDGVEGGRLVADVEGVALYDAGGGDGWLVASSQGDDSYAVYERRAPHAYVGSFRVVADGAAGIDGASETDGLDIVSAPLGAAFPRGLLVVQDGRNALPGAPQNFKLVSWARIEAALGLGVTAASPR